MKSSRTTTACSKIPAAKDTYLPGGALISTLGKWCRRVIASGSDDMGRWVWQKLIVKGGRKIQLISAYRDSQKSMPGPTTAYTQEYKMLQDMGHSDPHPRNKSIIDLTNHIKQATNSNEEIILALDANEDILPKEVPGPKHDIMTLMKDTNLIDVYEYQHNQKGDTSRRNTKKIDHVLISHNLLSAVKHSGFLPWNQIMEYDHCTGFADFAKTELFGETHRRPHPQFIAENLYRIS